MDGSIGRGLGGFLIGAAVVCFLIGAIIVGIIAWAVDDDYIESTTPITPEMIITTNGVQSDTLFIYREP